MPEPYYEQDGITIHHGDCREVLAGLPAGSVQCCVTSPPYWGLRSYLADDDPLKDAETGLEATPDEYVETIVGVFREVRRVLREDGTLWLNLGDTYTSGGRNEWRSGASDNKGQRVLDNAGHRPDTPPGLKPKDLVGIPWRVAFALQADGWWLRQDIIWHKPNAMPESVTDRCTKAHEYLFLLSKSARYHYDAKAIAEETTGNAHSRGGGVNPKCAEPGKGIKQNSSFSAAVKDIVENRNKRSVWTIPTQPYSEAHFATFPPELVKPCIKAGCPPGGVVLDPFGGSGTTAEVAKALGCKCISIELNGDYLKMQTNRLAQGVLPFSENNKAANAASTAE